MALSDRLRAMTTIRPAPTLGHYLRRAILIGFVVGFVVTVPATVLALIFGWAELLLGYVVPGGLLLRPLAPYMADWPGAVNMGLASVANGLVYSLVAAAIALLVWPRRRLDSGGMPRV
jgi:hypothetical protein